MTVPDQRKTMELLILAQKNNEPAREELIRTFLPGIKNIASGICGRSLDWSNDEELSVSLIAFNEAIDTFNVDKGMAFINYSKMLIHRRLVDYFRREKRFRHTSLTALETDNKLQHIEAEEAWSRYQQEEASREQGEIVTQYNSILQEYHVSLKDLLAVSPKHRDTKQTLMLISQKIASSPELLKKLRTKKQLPISELMDLTGVSRKVLERGRKYIIALTILLTEEEFSFMRDFINFPAQERW